MECVRCGGKYIQQTVLSYEEVTQLRPLQAWSSPGRPCAVAAREGLAAGGGAWGGVLSAVVGRLAAGEGAQLMEARV